MAMIINFKTKAKAEAKQEALPSTPKGTRSAYQVVGGLPAEERAEMMRMDRMGTFDDVHRWVHAAAMRMVYSWREAFIVDIADIQNRLEWNRDEDPGKTRDRWDQILKESIAVDKRAAAIYDRVFENIDALAQAGREQVAAQLETEFPNDPKAQRLGEFLRCDNPFEWLQGIEGEND